MAVNEENTRLQTTVSNELAKRIDILADRMNISQSKMVAMLLEAAVEEDEKIIKIMTSKYAKKLIEAFRPKTNN